MMLTLKGKIKAHIIAIDRGMFVGSVNQVSRLFLLPALFLMLVFTDVHAQPSAPEKTGEPDELYQLNLTARELVSTNPDSVHLLTQYIIATADSASMPYTVADARISEGLAYMTAGTWWEAEELFRNVLPVYRRLGDSLSVAVALDYLGFSLLDQGFIDQHFELQLQALDYRRRFDAPANDIARSYSIVGSVYFRQGELQRALEHYQQTLAIRQEISGLRPQFFGFTLRNMANVYAGQKRYEEAEQHYLMAIDSFSADRNNQFIIQARRLLGEMLVDMGRYQEAEGNYRTALQYAEQINNQGARGRVYLNLGRLYYQQDRHADALAELEQAHNYLASSNTFPELRDAYQLTSEIHEASGDNQQALYYFKAFDSIKDTLVTTESARNMAELRTQYDIAQKEQQIALLEANSRRDRAARLALLAGLIVSILAAALILRANARRKRAFAVLQATQAQLIQSEKMASLGQLTAGVAHEINNPVNFIATSVDALKLDVEDLQRLLDELVKLQENPEDPAKVQALLTLAKSIDLPYLQNELRELTANIEIGAHRTQDIVAALRGYSRESEGEFRKGDIHDTLNASVLILHHKLSDRIELHREYGQLPKVSCMANRLHQVFINLLDNAIQAIEDEGKIVITTSHLEAKHSVRISILDSGKGMSEETRNNAFNPFFTTKEVGQGTGLGLYVSYGIIQQHGGRISIHPGPEKGTEVVIELPVEGAS